MTNMEAKWAEVKVMVEKSMECKKADLNLYPSAEKEDIPKLRQSLVDKTKASQSNEDNNDRKKIEVLNDDEIVTLPEEDEMASTLPSTQLRRSFPLDSLVNYCSDPTQDSTLANQTAVFESGETMEGNESPSSRTKVPPPTLPKPKWYVESLRQKSPPVEQVIVTSTTLPTNQNTMLEPRDIKPTNQNTSYCLDDEYLDQQLAKDHSDIDNLFQQSASKNNNIRQSASHNKDTKQFQETCDNIVKKIDLVQQRLDTIASESDLGLRIELIDMEVDRIKAEYSTTLSRGETLILILQRQNTNENIQASIANQVTILREKWSFLTEKQSCKKDEANDLISELEKFLTLRENMLVWLEDIRRKIEVSKNDKKELGSIARRMELKKSDLTNINKLGTKLTAANAFKGQENSLSKLNKKWENAKKDCSIVSIVKEETNSKSGSVAKSYPAELKNKIIRLREAISAIDTQLDLSVLKGKKYENFQAKQETLDRAKTAFETLKPNMKKLDKDLELVSGSVSIECFENLTGLGEKFREEWRTVSEKFAVKKKDFEEAKREYEEMNILNKLFIRRLEEKKQHLNKLHQVHFLSQ